ncbi:hypothetical protein TorRG33x02_137350 [Trema orientale]|uniref:Uncharacterized protein n=1 Tax=Trema orientale TaxID=63057 RepID=A0A2P5EY36_TREOI|nr:hypothetical protein TorRG33x02_137350 [Trema orientale]
MDINQNMEARNDCRVSLLTREGNSTSVGDDDPISGN